MSYLKIYLTAFFVLPFVFSNYAQNPFKSIGVDAKVHTLSKGKFDEVHEKKKFERIGEVVINTETKEIAYFVEKDTAYSEARMEPEVISRWWSPDPLARKYPENSPYVFTKDNPIIYVDKEGKDVWISFTSASIQGGAGYGAGAMTQVGRAEDNYGKTYYKAQATVLFDNDLEEGTNTPELTIGASVSFASLTGVYDWQSETFKESTQGQSPVEWSLGPVNAGIAEGKISLGGSLGLGLGISSVNADKITAFSLTEDELQNLQPISDVNQLGVANKEQVKEDGEIVGERGVLTISGEGTDVKVFREINPNKEGENKKTFWESEGYREAQEEEKE